MNKGRRGSYALVRRGWDVLAKHGVDVNVLCTVNSANAPYPVEVYRHFRDDLGARFLQFIPVVERVPERLSPHGRASGRGLLV